MLSLMETDQVVIYIGLDQAIFVLRNSHVCPQCGRPASLFRFKNGETRCVGCDGAPPGDKPASVVTGPPVTV